MSLIILGIESSCDETAAAVCKDGEIINNIIATQEVHKKYGGVVPELASREHQKNIVPVIQDALQAAGCTLGDLNAIAYTQGPGLLGALLVGSSFARATAMALDIPTIPVNHMQGHIMAHFIDKPHPSFPFLCLTVSGGHTQLVRVNDHLDMKVIGHSKDDAVGEAFDKCAKLMGIGYPGGPQIDKLAKEGDPYKYDFPKSDIPGLDYSFSGIKTAFMYFLRNGLQRDADFIKNNEKDLAASIQRVLIDMLMDKLVRAAKQEGIQEIAIAGGVSANNGLRERLKLEADKRQWKVHTPAFEYCTDNAAMIAITGYYHFVNGQMGSLRDSPQPRMSFG